MAPQQLDFCLWLSKGFPLNSVSAATPLDVPQYSALIVGKANVQIRHFSSIFCGEG